MNSKSDDIANEAASPNTSEARLIILLRDSRLVVRTNALMTLSSRVPANEAEVVEAITSTAQNYDGLQKVWGNLNERMLAVLALARIGTPSALEAGSLIRSEMTEHEIKDLDWFAAHPPW